MENFSIEFKSCPICGEKKTVTQEVVKPLKEEGKIPKEAFASMEKKAVPLLDITRVGLAVSVPVMISHFDVCNNCGHYYCIKVEVSNAPIKAVMPGQVQGGPFPINR